jgi:hypothetical protein
MYETATKHHSNTFMAPAFAARTFLILPQHLWLALKSSVAEPERKELHHLVGAGAVTRCGSDGSGSDSGITHG